MGPGRTRYEQDKTRDKLPVEELLGSLLTFSGMNVWGVPAAERLHRNVPCRDIICGGIIYATHASSLFPSPLHSTRTGHHLFLLLSLIIGRSRFLPKHSILPLDPDTFVILRANVFVPPILRSSAPLRRKAKIHRPHPPEPSPSSLIGNPPRGVLPAHMMAAPTLSPHAHLSPKSEPSSQAARDPSITAPTSLSR
ncbi:hypothetical protein E2C01_005415 [Portunus trituberculatus]|uniref:Uncharacterized protein n=1 Tax=Portunus trituberculatus TaxID=210409 RepID=A0A5B7CTF9_PORTR|nr:hypothetical protein [Portunus trituberculatus]